MRSTKETSHLYLTLKSESPKVGHVGNPGAEGYWLRHISVFGK